MSFLVINDLTKNKTLDHKVMKALKGGIDPMKALAAANHLNAQAEAERLNGMAEERRTPTLQRTFAFSSPRYFRFF